jgi:Rod binding domain-containing protein
MNTTNAIMNASASRLAEIGDPSVARQRSLEDQASFASVLSRAQAGPGKNSQTPEQKAREAAEQLVATALVQPVLKQLRETNNAAEPFKPNSAERSFGQMMDTALSQRIVGSKSWALVDRVAATLMKRSSGVSESASPQGSAISPAAEGSKR